MRKWTLTILCLLLAAVLVQAGSAYSVKTVNVPKTDLRSGDQVKTEIEMSFVAFSYNHNIEVSSDLEDTSCVVQSYNQDSGQYNDLLLDKDRTGTYSLVGWLLPTDASFTLKLTFQGKVPTVSSTQNITLLHVSELSGAATVAGGEYTLTGRVINPGEVTTQITAIRSDVSKLKADIDTKVKTGIDGSAALAKANEAENALTKADSQKSTNFAQALDQVEIARTAVSDGYTQLDKAEARYDIGLAENTIGDVDELIVYFTTNRSISQTDPRLIAITNKYDLASQSLSSANDMVNNGNYVGAQSKAAEASRYAADAYNLSLSLRGEIGEGGGGLSLPGINPLFLGIGLLLVILVVVGFVVYKKYYKWDELG